MHALRSWVTSGRSSRPCFSLRQSSGMKRYTTTKTLFSLSSPPSSRSLSFLPPPSILAFSVFYICLRVLLDLRNSLDTSSNPKHSSLSSLPLFPPRGSSSRPLSTPPRGTTETLLMMPLNARHSPYFTLSHSSSFPFSSSFSSFLFSFSSVSSPVFLPSLFSFFFSGA